MEFKENLRGDILDEIALEGLEGITISGIVPHWKSIFECFGSV